MLRPVEILGIFLLLGGGALAHADESASWEDSSSLLAAPRQWVSTFGYGSPEDAMGLPLAIASVTRAELDKSEYQNLQQSIRSTPSVGGANAEGIPSWWNPGVSLRGLGGPRVALLSQGVALAPRDLEVGDGANLSLYDPFSVERIEISRGSQAVQFGGSALGGVINVVPRAPKQRDLFGVSVNGRSAFDGAVNAMRHSGLIDLGGQDVALIAGGSSVGSERPVTPGESDTVTDGNYRSASGWFNSRAQLGDSAMLRVRGELNNNSDITLLSRPPDSSSEQAVGGGAEVQAPQYRRSLLSAELSGNNDGALIDSYRSTISWQQAARNTDTVLFPSPLEPISADDTVNTLLWNTVAVRQLGRSRLSAGYELGVVGSTLEDEAESKSSLTTARLDATQNSSALFAEAFIPVSNFELRPGMRLEYLSSHDRYGDFTANDIGTSATMAALYRWTEERALYLTTSSAYRNPTLSERFYAGRIIGAADPGILRGDSGISGERGNSIEAGLKETTAYHSMRLAGFYSRINNYIGIDSQSGDEEGVVRELQYRNFTAVSVRGVEAEASYQVLDEVQLFGNIAQSWSSSAERMDLPALIANYGLRYQQDLCDCTSLKQFTGTIYARSVGSSTDRTSAVIVERFPSGESFSTLNFEGALEFAPLPVGDLTLLFGARNLANTRYREPFYNQLQPGLTGYVALTLAY